MRYTRGYKSDQVDDRRSQRAAGGGLGGGLGGGGANLLVGLFRRFGIPGVVVGAAFLYFTGGLDLGGAGSSGSPGATRESMSAEQPLVEFVSFVFDDVQRTWNELLPQQNESYRLARLVLFRDRTQSACGLGQAAMGPFYCPADQQAYIDLGFYAELKQRLGAPGDFAQAYVIAHEVGHHVQHVLGANQRVHSASESQQAGERGLLVRLELQADCYAGVWAHNAQRRELLEVGDLDEALNAATRIGDDAMQKQSTGVVRPESFTHGTSAQRKRWLQKGFDSGDPKQCDTFSASTL